MHDLQPNLIIKSLMFSNHHVGVKVIIYTNPKENQFVVTFYLLNDMRATISRTVKRKISKHGIRLAKKKNEVVIMRC